MLNSKELLEKTGISRATLNNYIALGIVPRPDVLPPEPQDGAAPRIGYFPDGTLERIAEIQRLKNEGWSMAAIAEHFAPGRAGAPVARPIATTQAAAAPREPIAGPSAERLSAAAGPAGAEAAPKRRRPFLSDVAVLAMDLQDAARIWSALPAEEYFELIDEIWVAAEPVFRRHQGVPGKHPADGIVCYFLPQRETDYLSNALAAAVEIREALRRLSKEWQLRKRWTTELYMNTGLDEGQQWLGSLRTAGEFDFTMFGDTLNRALRLSDFARFGAVWAAKSLVLKLPPEHKHRLRYGVHRRDREGRHVFVPSVFATVDRLAEGGARTDARLHEIGRLAITEIVDIAPADRRRERPADPHPI